MSSSQVLSINLRVEVEIELLVDARMKRHSPVEIIG